MTNSDGCLFRIGYFLYTRTSLGYFYHKQNIAKAQEKLNGGSHSKLTTFNYGDLQILPIPMVLDNYAYLITDKLSNTSVVIDPGHAQPVQVLLSERNTMPEAVLITHKHWDHSGGNSEMLQHYPKLRIFGSSSDHVPDITDTIQDGDLLQFGGLRFKALLTPGHTVGHMVYVLDGRPFQAPDSVFSGDHFFLGGCGRIFEGSCEIMLRSLDSVCSLPDDALVWPGHEIAKENLEFACLLDPGNKAAQEKLQWVKTRREKELCTCPSTLGEEKQYNPFLRTAEESVMRLLGFVQGEANASNHQLRARILGEIRERKNQFNLKRN